MQYKKDRSVKENMPSFEKFYSESRKKKKKKKRITNSIDTGISMG
tara:strand:+ start:29 stop:163 length:135 start_codon:yes stop_codon:yes gene_type:complete